MPTSVNLHTAPQACPSVSGISDHASFLGVLTNMLTAVEPSLLSISMFLNITIHVISNVLQAKQDAC